MSTWPFTIVLPVSVVESMSQVNSMKKIFPDPIYFSLRRKIDFWSFPVVRFFFF
jgi:hypothetical protein